MCNIFITGLGCFKVVICFVLFLYFHVYFRSISFWNEPFFSVLCVGFQIKRSDIFIYERIYVQSNWNLVQNSDTINFLYFRVISSSVREYRQTEKFGKLFKNILSISYNFQYLFNIFPVDLFRCHSEYFLIGLAIFEHTSKWVYFCVLTTLHRSKLNRICSLEDIYCSVLLKMFFLLSEFHWISRVKFLKKCKFIPYTFTVKYGIKAHKINIFPVSRLSKTSMSTSINRRIILL